jgi:hypothetical protein
VGRIYIEDPVNISRTMQNADNFYSLTDFTIKNNIAAFRKAAQIWFELITPSSGLRHGCKHLKTLGESVKHRESGIYVIVGNVESNLP